MVVEAAFMQNTQCKRLMQQQPRDYTVAHRRY